jgi:hypothetical protein
MSEPTAYMREPWFAVLQAAVKARSGKAVAAELDVSGGMVSMVLNGKGAYGTGKASTARFAAVVMERLNVQAWECPHLTKWSFGKPFVISLEQCRRFAHYRKTPQSYEDGQHMKACQQCPHKARSAPPPPPPPEPRQRKRAAQPAPSTTPAKGGTP